MNVLPRKGVLVAIWVFSALNVVVAVLPPAAGAAPPARWLAICCYLAALVVATAALRGGARREAETAPIAVLTCAAVLLPVLDAIGVPGPAAGASSWCVGAVTSIAALLGWRGRRGPVVLAWASLVAVDVRAGVDAVLTSGTAALLAAFVLGVLLVRMLSALDRETGRIEARRQEALARTAVETARHLERETRMAAAGEQARPMLRRIIEAEGDLGAASRRECRILEQTLRDEVRGRALLNENVRREVRRARERGARVMLLDEDTLRDLTPARRDRVLDEVAAHIAAVPSNRIVVRSGAPRSETAVTIVATTVDETAAALGLDDAEHVDRWVSVGRT